MSWSAAATAASGAAGLAGSLIQNAANAKLAKKQMDFQERMRKTQYQTSMKDMRKAGLNPILAYKTGGAGTPSGTSAIMQNSANSAIDAMAKTSGARTNARSQKQDARMKSVLKDTQWQQQQLIQDQADATQKQADLTWQKYQTEKENTNSARMANDVKSSFLKSIKKTGKIKSDNKWLQYLDITTQSLGNVLGNSNSAKSLFNQ